jgi:hypothetical protein
MIMRVCIVFFSIILLFLQGCVAIQSFPTVARAGDTVTLAVGSAEGMTKANTTLTFTPDDTGIPIAIPASSLRSVLNIYPDKRSPAWSNSFAIAIDSTAGHGGWLTVLVVDLPVDLPVGTGVINVQTPATYTYFNTGVIGVDIALEVLSSGGVPATFDYIDSGSETFLAGDLSQLEPAPHYLIKPDFTSTFFVNPWPAYGAIEIKVIGTITGVPESAIDNSIRVVLDDMQENMISHMQMDWARNGDTITINIISSKGLLQYFEARASLFFNRDIVNYVTTPTITARYFDVNGDVVPGPIIKVAYVTS